MDAIACLKTRRSIRRFTQDPVPDAVLRDIVDCARLAPTAMNRQPWTFVVVQDGSRRSRIADLTGHATFLADAPVAIAVFCSSGDYWVEDGSAATMNLLNAAHASGLGSCWVAGHPMTYADPIAAMLGAPNEQKLLAIVAIGYPAESPAPEKRTLDDVLRWERF
jgi:nitroreductase